MVSSVLTIPIKMLKNTIWFDCCFLYSTLRIETIYNNKKICNLLLFFIYVKLILIYYTFFIRSIYVVSYSCLIWWQSYGFKFKRNVQIFVAHLRHWHFHFTLFKEVYSLKLFVLECVSRAPAICTLLHYTWVIYMSEK